MIEMMTRKGNNQAFQSQVFSLSKLVDLYLTEEIKLPDKDGHINTMKRKLFNEILSLQVKLKGRGVGTCAGINSY